MMTYDDWITAVFDHGVTKPAWFFKAQNEAPAALWRLDKHPAAAVQLITRTFQECGSLPERFSDGQIADGLNFIINASCSNLGFAIFDVDNNIDIAARLHCIQAIYIVYKALFAVRCSPHLGHTMYTHDPAMNPLNGVCYMWWDVAPVYARPDNPRYAELDQAVLKVLGKTLAIKSEPCREGALHGLGHWADGYPEAVAEIIDRGLAKKSGISSTLKAYARSAKRGAVL